MKKKNIYNNKFKTILLTVACSSALIFAGCQNDSVGLNYISDKNNQSIHDVDNNKDLTTPVESEIPESHSPVVTEGSSEETTALFSDMSNYQFVFSSGVGAWQTMLTINEDGTFKGEYSDSDLGSTGEDYPNGIVYSSTFEGKFTKPEKVNEYTYSLQIEYISLEKELGSEQIIDGIKYVYSKPYGINDAKEILIYTPGAPVKELPDGFRSWVSLMNLDELKDEYLGFYGLYNVETENGFSSYKLDE